MFRFVALFCSCTFALFPLVASDLNEDVCVFFCINFFILFTISHHSIDFDGKRIDASNEDNKKKRVKISDELKENLSQLI